MSGPTIAPGEEEDPLLLDRQVCFPLYVANNLIGRLYRPVLSELGLTYLQYLVLLVLWERESQTVGALGARLYLDSGTLTPVLKRMEADNLLSRRRDPRDERRVLIALTEEGHALRARALHVPTTLADGYNPEGVDELRETIRSLVSVLAQLVVKSSPADAGIIASGPHIDD